MKRRAVYEGDVYEEAGEGLLTEREVKEEVVRVVKEMSEEMGQVRVAEELRVSRALVWMVVKGRREPSVGLMEKFGYERVVRWRRP